MQALSKLSVLALICFLPSLAPASPHSQVFTGAYPRFLPIDPTIVNQVDDCTVSVEAGRDFLLRKTVKFVVTNRVEAINFSEVAHSANIVQADLEKALARDAQFERQDNGSFKENSIQVRKYFSKSGKEIWQITVKEYSTLIYITGSQATCEIYPQDPLNRPVYEIKAGEAPEAL